MCYSHYLYFKKNKTKVKNIILPAARRTAIHPSLLWFRPYYKVTASWKEFVNSLKIIIRCNVPTLHCYMKVIWSAWASIITLKLFCNAIESKVVVRDLPLRAVHVSTEDFSPLSSCTEEISSICESSTPLSPCTKEQTQFFPVFTSHGRGSGNLILFALRVSCLIHSLFYQFLKLLIHVVELYYHWHY